MSLDPKFLFLDVEEQCSPSGHMRTVKDVLHFSIQKRHLGNPKLDPEDVVLKALKSHADQYQDAWSDFKKAHPDYRAPWEPEPMPEDPAAPESDAA